MMTQAIMIKINIGSGPNVQRPGFINIDNSPSIWLAKVPWIKALLHHAGFLTAQQLRDDWRGVIKSDASRKLPFADGSVDRIYSSHFLEHLPYEKARKTLRECHRILSPDGVMRLVVPDLLWHAEQYIQKTRQLLNSSPANFDRKPHDDFMETVSGSYLNRKRFGALHCYMYDYPTLYIMLQKIGFGRITLCGYRQGEDKDLASLDNRPGESLHLEIRKN